MLEVIYLVFNEGYAATAGDDWMRPALCEDALRLGRILAELAPDEPEVHGLVALMEIQASRVRARRPGGAPVLLLEQNRARWDQLLIRRGLAALARAEKRWRGRRPAACRYALQAAIAAATRGPAPPEETDWERIAALYAELAQLAPSPIVELNRAVALGMAYGPAAGLDAGRRARRRAGAGELPPAAERARRPAGQARALPTKRAPSSSARPALTRNVRERELLLERAAECDAAASAMP